MCCLCVWINPAQTLALLYTYYIPYYFFIPHRTSFTKCKGTGVTWAWLVLVGDYSHTLLISWWLKWSTMSPPPPSLDRLCIVGSLYNGQRYLTYPIGDCVVLDVVKCWYAVGIQYLTSVCHALNHTAGSTGKEWNHSAKLNCIIISWAKWWNLWHEWFLTEIWRAWLSLNMFPLGIHCSLLVLPLGFGV